MHVCWARRACMCLCVHHFVTPGHPASMSRAPVVVALRAPPDHPLHLPDAAVHHLGSASLLRLVPPSPLPTLARCRCAPPLFCVRRAPQTLQPPLLRRRSGKRPRARPSCAGWAQAGRALHTLTGTGRTWTATCPWCEWLCAASCVAPRQLLCAHTGSCAPPVFVAVRCPLSRPWPAAMRTHRQCAASCVASGLPVCD